MNIENIKIIELRCPNIRELTKKEKFYGLNVKSWYVCLIVPLALQAYIGFLNAMFIFFSLLVIFYIAEFFDEDISDIFFSKIVIKNPSSQYLA